MAPISIDKQPIPGWVRGYLSKEQLSNPPLLSWVLLAYQRKGWNESHTNVVQRLFIGTAFKDEDEDKKDWRSEVSIARDLNMSRQTAHDVLKDLVKEGWIVKETRPGKPSYNWPSFPKKDCLTPSDGPVLCSAPTKSGKHCTKRAGWGTETPSQGPCKLHRETAVPVQPLDTSEIQPLDTSESATCPTVGQVPVQPDDTYLSNGWTQVHKEVHQESSSPSSSSPYVAEVEVPAPRAPHHEEEEEIAKEQKTNPEPERAIIVALKRAVLEHYADLTDDEATAAAQEIDTINPAINDASRYVGSLVRKGTLAVIVERVRKSSRAKARAQAPAGRCPIHVGELPCISCAADAKGKRDDEATAAAKLAQPPRTTEGGHNPTEKGAALAREMWPNLLKSVPAAS